LANVLTGQLHQVKHAAVVQQSNIPTCDINILSAVDAAYKQ